MENATFHYFGMDVELIFFVSLSILHTSSQIQYTNNRFDEIYSFSRLSAGSFPPSHRYGNMPLQLGTRDNTHSHISTENLYGTR